MTNPFVITRWQKRRPLRSKTFATLWLERQIKRPRDIWYAAGRDKNKSPGIVNHRNWLHGNRQTMTMCQRHVTRRWTRKHDKNTLPPCFGGEVIFFAADCTAGVSRERAGNLQYFSMEGEQGAGCARWMKKRDFLSREGYGRLVYSIFFFLLFFLRHFTSKKSPREISCFVDMEFVNSYSDQLYLRMLYLKENIWNCD